MKWYRLLTIVFLIINVTDDIEKKYDYTCLELISILVIIFFYNKPTLDGLQYNFTKELNSFPKYNWVYKKKISVYRAR